MTKQSANKRILRGDFEGIALEISETGEITVDVSKAENADRNNVKVITASGPVQLTKFSPMFEHAPAPDVINATPTIESFELDNAIIRAGQVQLNEISPYLSDLPDTAIAELLVSPKDLKEIDGGGPGTWVSSIERIRNIQGYYGLDGMQVFDRPKLFDCLKIAPFTPYEKAWANQIRTAFNQVADSGQAVRTGWFMPTKELVHGRKNGAGPEEITVENNLYDLRDRIAKEGNAFVTTTTTTTTISQGGGLACFQWASTENPRVSSYVSDVLFMGRGSSIWSLKDNLDMSSRPVALEIQP